MSEILYGNEFAIEIKNKISEEIVKKGIRAKLGIIYVGDDPGSKSYRLGVQKAALAVGVEVQEFSYQDIDETSLIKEIEKINNQKDISGIMLQMPLPKGFDSQKVIDAIDPKKDVDGLTSQNIANLYTNKKGFVPCTAQSVMEMLNHYNVEIDGKNVVVIGRSASVGRPVSQLLLNKNGTVTMCHSHTRDLSDIVRRADILVVAIGRAKFVKEDWVSDGTVIIDVGINYDENGKLVGDVDFANVINKDVRITPVPKGVGSLTTAILLRNVLEAARGEI